MLGLFSTPVRMDVGHGVSIGAWLCSSVYLVAVRSAQRIYLQRLWGLKSFILE